MQTLLKSLVSLVVLTTGLTTQAQAQLITYHFTGTKASGSDGIGSTISGSLTLDGGAPGNVTDWTPIYGCGETGWWSDGGLSINVITNTGYTAGTSMGGQTVLYVADLPCLPAHQTVIANNRYDGDFHLIDIGVISLSFAATGDGIANVPNPWLPLAEQFQYIFIQDNDYGTGVFEYGEFTLDTFTSTIIIAGCDTGIQDFIYNWKLVSQHLASCAAGAKNHGDYVSCVAKLTNELTKAGLLTGVQKGVIMSCAANSNIGK